MREKIVRASPALVAAIGSLPFAVAIAALASEVLTSRGAAAFAGAVFAGVASFLAWSWVVGHALNERIPAERRPSVGAVRAAAFYVAIYAAWFLSGFAVGGGPLAVDPLLAAALHLAALAGAVVVLRFVAVNLALAEESDEAVEPWSTALSLFSIAGVLVVQKRVNRLFDRAASPR